MPRKGTNKCPKCIAFGDAPGAETVGERCNSVAAQWSRWNGGLGMFNTIIVFTALSTLRASRFTVMLAKMFGQKIVVSDSGCTITVHKWRGKWYLTDCKYEVPNTKGEAPQ